MEREGGCGESGARAAREVRLGEWVRWAEVMRARVGESTGGGVSR